MSENQNALTVRETNAVTNTTMSVADVLMSEGVWNRANAMGKALMKTSYLGRGTSEFGATMAVITMAKQNMDPVEFSRAYNMIGDKPEMKPNYALGLFKMAGGKYKFNQADEDVCDMEFTAPDGTSARISVRMEKMLETDVPWTSDKSGNRILKSNWANHPDDMLFARCCGKALRRVWPEHMGGIHLAGEIDHDEANAAPQKKTITTEDVKARVAKVAKANTCANAAKAVEPSASNAVVDSEIVERTRAEEAEIQSETDAHANANEVSSFDMSYDPTRCPIAGPYLNAAFDEMEPDVLAFLIVPSVREKHPEFTDEHYANAKAAYDKKIGAAE